MRRRHFMGITAGFICAGATDKPTAFTRADAADSYAQAVLSKRPAAYWRLGERSGQTAHDASNNHHDGTFRGRPAFGEPGAIRDDPDGAVAFDGRSDYVEIPDSLHFSQPSSDRGLTVEAWMRPDILTFPGETNQRYVHWLGKGDAGEFEWGFRFYSLDSPSRPNRISAYIWNAAGGEGAGAYFQDALIAGRWMHVVACFSPGDRSDANAGVSIYRDGSMRANPRTSRGARYSSYAIEPSHGPAPLRFATRDLGSFFSGALDDVAVYPRVLTGAEIADNYRASMS
jgi:hypothetical protein